MTTAAEKITETIAAGIKPAPFGIEEGGYPNYRANVDKVCNIPLGRKGYGASETECCAYCGKLAMSAKFWGYFTGMGDWVKNDEGNNIDDLGYYPVGSDCARRLKKVVPIYTSADAGNYMAGMKLVA